MIDLKNVEKYRENNRIEAKKALGGLPHSIWETYSAFANTLGGVILLGVEESRDKTFHVLDLPCPEKLIEEFKEKLSDRKKVSTDILSERDITVETLDGKRFIAINIPRAHRFDKPVFIDGNAIGGTYRRGGEGDYRCSVSEVEAMQRDAVKHSADMTIVKNFSQDDFNKDTISKYRDRFNILHPGNIFETVDDTDFLSNIGAVEKGEDGIYYPTLAGIMLFAKAGKANEIYPSFSPSYIETNEDGQITLTYKGENLFDFYLKAEERILRGICLIGMNRAEEISVSKAVFEAIINSVIHADYNSDGCVEVHFGPYSISVMNPGSLRISPDMIMSARISDRRNALLAKMFYRVGIGSGTGGIRGIYEIWRKKNWCPPVLREEFSPDRVTLTLIFGTALDENVGAPTLTDSRLEAVIDYITEHIEADIGEISSLLGITEEIASILLSDLKNKDIITEEDRNNKIYYKLKA
ncbi:MAG: putative DNA binding domain-containing protein [Clostridia bacterium]|nr:putative DNA binding domain-containing protein [Clostridia bacterium]